MNEDTVKRLVKECFVIMKAHYTAGPIGRERVFEALNALAIVAATVLAGATKDGISFAEGGADEAIDFFLDCLSRQLTSLNVVADLTMPPAGSTLS